MDFTAEKDEGTIPFVLSQILDTCVNGITLSDPDQPDNPIVYANAAFELITGYDNAEILGRNCRFLQGQDRDQPEIDRIREAVREQKPVTVTLRNYRKNGTLFSTASRSALSSTARADWSITLASSTTSPRASGRRKSCAGSTPSSRRWASVRTERRRARQVGAHRRVGTVAPAEAPTKT